MMSQCFIYFFKHQGKKTTQWKMLLPNRDCVCVYASVSSSNIIRTDVSLVCVHTTKYKNKPLFYI